MEQAPGIRFNEKGEAEISVWAPLAKKVTMLVNGHLTIALAEKGFGYWQATTNEVRPGDRYLLLLDDKGPVPDVAALAQPEGVHGPSQVIDLKGFEWTDNSWENPALNDYLIYELHTGTFTPGGTFAALEGKLDYLKDLGITAIEIMPVAQFPGERNWGYDGVFPYAVQNSYGGAFGLMHLVDACHSKGLAVILDVVYNHLGPEGNYMNNYGPYFTDKYHTPWGNAINFDDAWCDGVRHYYTANALMWFRDFHIDALRLDAVHAIKDFSPVHILREIKERVNELMEETGKVYHLIVELDLNDTRFINPLQEQGYGMDAQWVDEFHHALRVTAGEPKTGYYSDFNGINHLAKSYKDAYVFDGIYSPHRQKTFGTKTNNPGNQFVVFAQNHDQTGNRMLGERSSQLFSFEMQKLLAGAVLVSPFIPLLFMGEEWGAQTPFLYFVSHTDPELIKAVQKGRKEEFGAFHTGAEPPDPEAEETFLRSKLQWDSSAQANSAVMQRYYRFTIALRSNTPALHVLNRQNLKVTVAEEDQVLLLERWHEEQHVCCVLNFSNQQQPVKLPQSQVWENVLDSADGQWSGSGSSDAQDIVQPESIIIYRNYYV